MGRRRKEAAPVRSGTPRSTATYRGADAQAILGHPVEIDQVLLAEHGHGVGEQAIEELQVINAEVGQGVVIDEDAAAQPVEGVMLDAQEVEGAGTADAFEGGVQPQGGQKGRVDGGPPWATRDGADLVVQGGQVDSLDKVPNHARLVVGVEKILQTQGGQELFSVDAAQPRLRLLGRPRFLYRR